jgi:cytochrome c oxidase subunit 2
MRNIVMRMLLIATLAVPCAYVSSAHAQSPQTIEITAQRFNFTPGEITVKKGQPVVLILKSADVAHGLRIRDLNVNVKVDAGGTARVEFTPDKTGDFVGSCSVFCGPGHGTMKFTVHVVA